MAARKKQNNAPVDKDDGTRWVVMDKQGRQVYPGSGVPRKQAEHLAQGLLQATDLRQVN